MICETCIYRNENEYHKPCIVYRDNCEFYEREGDMTREEAIELLKEELQTSIDNKEDFADIDGIEKYNESLDMAIKALEQEPKTGWNNHQIACMLADLFGDACACNYNGIDEWLGELCDFKDTCCPNPVGVACWEQFLKYSQSRYTECGYEVRDKNALQEPKTGHWSRKTKVDAYDIAGVKTWGIKCQCDRCDFTTIVVEDFGYYNYCPNCGCRMVEPQESEEI